MAQLESLSGRVGSHQTDSAFASEGGQQQDTVDQLEMQFYGIQLELYDAKFEILKYEEQLLLAQTDSLRRQIRGGLDTVGRFMQGERVLNILCTSNVLMVWFTPFSVRIFKLVKIM